VECLPVMIMSRFCMLIYSIAYVNNNIQLFQLQVLHEISRLLNKMNWKGLWRKQLWHVWWCHLTVSVQNWGNLHMWSR